MADETPKPDEVKEVKAEEPVQVATGEAEVDVGPESEAAGQELPAETAAEAAAGSASDAAVEPAAENEAEADESAMTAEELEEARANEVAFSWQASEYVHHHKGPGWYGALFGGLAVLVLLVLLLRLWLEAGLFVVMGVAVIVYAKKPPRTLTYELTPKGITIEGKQYLFSEFRSFGVLKDEDWHTIDLEPMKRLAPRLSILFDPDDFDSVVGHLELHLPRADRDPDPIEKLSRYLRF